MGEFMEQMMGGGPPLIPLREVPGYIPGLPADLAAGADPVAAGAALSVLRPRTVPAPHREYGHLLFGVAMCPAEQTREGAIRALASAVGSAHGAPTFGSCMGDVPPTRLAAALTVFGFAETARRWLEALRLQRMAEAARVQGTPVWEIPESWQKDGDSDVAVAVHEGRLVGVDFSTHGERVWGLSPCGVTIPGIPFVRADFIRAFGGDEWRGQLSSPGAMRLTAHLTQLLGPPRSVRLLELHE